LGKGEVSMKLGYLAASIALVALAGQAVAQGNSQNRGQGPDRTVQGQGNGGGQARGGPNAGNGQNRGNDNAGQGQGQGRSNAGNQGNRQASNNQSANPGRSNAQGQGNNRGQGNAGNRNNNAQNAQRGNRPLDRDIDRVLRDRDRRGGDFRLGYGDRPGRGLINGCPPGLAKKYNGCQPPGQARQSIWQRGGFYGYRSNDPFRILDGYLLRMGSGGRILGYDPLLGGALRIGNLWPEGQRYYDEPDYRRRYYGYGDNYRSYGNAVYRMDPETQAIASVAALLTGQDIAVGQPMPRGYDAYNVPYRYRSQYSDGPDAAYRYSDGYVYRLDPETRLVQAAIELLL
jgi:hypothetical protein